jgi:hypothetical protein
MKREALLAAGGVAVLFIEALMALVLSWIVKAENCGSGNGWACDETVRNVLRAGLIVVPALYATLYVVAARRERSARGQNRAPRAPN